MLLQHHRIKKTNRTFLGQLQNMTHFFLLPQVDFHTVHRNHNVDFLLLDVFHLEFILQRENKQHGFINTQVINV